MENIKIIGAAVAALGVGGAIGYNIVEPEVETKVEYIINETVVELPAKVIVEEKIVNNTIEIPVNVTEYVEVDNENLNVVLDHIYDNDGDIEYIIDDLDNDEVEKIAYRVILVNEFKKLAVDAVESELIDELDKMVVGGVTLDEDEVERLRIDSDLDEIVVNDIDFEDKDATIVVSGTFEHEDVDYEYTVDVVFKDNEFDEITNINVVEE